MNQRDRQRVRSENFRLLKRGQPRNVVRLNTGNTLEHEIGKMLCAWHRAKLYKHEFVTEAEFKTGGRCDFFDLDTGDIIEVLHSEKPEAAMRKCAKYPREHTVELRSSAGKFINIRMGGKWMTARITGAKE